MTIQQLIKQLQFAIKLGYKPDTRICVDTGVGVVDEETYWGISLDTDSSYGHKDQWKISLNVYEKNERKKEVPLARTYKDDIADHYAQTLRESKRMEMELKIFGSIEENNNE